MKKWLLAAGFVGVFAVGSLTAGSVFSYASSNPGLNDMTSNMMSENQMMGSNNGSGMMGDSNAIGMMGSMSGMMNTMSIMADLMADIINEAAKTLGMTTDQLQNEIQSGKSLAAVAEEKGVKTDKFVKELEKVIQKDIKQFEKEGNMIPQQQKEMLLSMSDNMEMMVNTAGIFSCHNSLVDSM